MEIKIKENSLNANNILKIVGIGYFFGAGLLFAIPLSLALISVPFLGEPDEKQALLLSIIFVPFILFFQAIIFALIVTLGHWINKKIKLIKLEFEE